MIKTLEQFKESYNKLDYKDLDEFLNWQDFSNLIETYQELLVDYPFYISELVDEGVLAYYNIGGKILVIDSFKTEYETIEDMYNNFERIRAIKISDITNHFNSLI